MEDLDRVKDANPVTVLVRNTFLQVLKEQEADKEATKTRSCS